MAWDTDMIMMLRSIINDDAEPYEYSSVKLKDLLITSAVNVIMAVDFDRSYTVDVSDRSITPDPTAHSDIDFQILVVLKAACILARAEHKSKTMYGVSIKDGPSTINTGDVGKLTKEWADDICKQYQDAVLAYKMGNGLSGSGIAGPYDLGFHPRVSRKSGNIGRSY